MPRLKTSDTSFDPDELEEGEYEEREFYKGPPPPGGIILGGFIKRLWMTETGEKSAEPGSDMLVVMFEAKDNVGGYEKYDGWTSWERIALQKNTRWRWQPFLDATGINLRKLKTAHHSNEVDNTGLVLDKIDGWGEPGEDNDSAWVQVLTKNDYYQGNRRAVVDKFLEWGDGPTGPEDDDEVEEEEEETPPTRTRRTARSASSAAKPAARSRRKPPEPEEDEEDEEFDEDEVDEDEVDEEAEEEEQEEEKPAPRRRSARTAAKPAAAKPAATTRARSRAASTAKPAASTRGRSRAGKGSTEEPPF